MGNAVPGNSESRIKRVTAFLELRMSQMHSYHDHKETMAHAALLVALAYVGAILSTDPWPPSWVPAVSVSQGVVAMSGTIAVWLFIHVYMRWQLRNRRVAAQYVACLLQLLRSWANTPPSDDDLKPCEEKQAAGSKVNTWIDLFVPWEAARVLSDEGMGGYPTAMARAYRETATGALWAEKLVSYGSIVLGLILLAKTWP
jgi:hypothetical protein